MSTKSVRCYVIGYDGARETRLEADSDGSYLDNMQDVVGGLLQPFNVLFSGGVELYVDDEGLYSKPANRCISATPEMAEAGYLSIAPGTAGGVVRPGELYTVLHGPILAVAYGADGDLRDMTDSEIAEVDAYFSKEEHGPGSGCLAEMAIAMDW